MARPRKVPIASVEAGPVAGQQEIVIPTLGSTPLALANLSAYEQQTIKQFQGAFSKLMSAHNNPMWNDQQELNDAAVRSFSASVGANPASGNINDRFSKRHTVADMNTPRNPVAMIQLSMKYGFENPFAAKGLRVKTDFTVKNFEHRTTNLKSKKFYDDYAIKLQIQTKLKKIVWTLYCTGVCPIYWGGEKGGPLNFMQILNPADCHWIETPAGIKLFLKITAGMIAAVRDPLGKENPMNKAQYDSMPDYWIKAIQDHVAANGRNGWGVGLIELAEGSYAFIENRYAPFLMQQNTLDGIPLQGAFDAFQRYRLLAAGDFAVAWNVKNMLTLISEGDPKADPKQYKPLDDVRLAKLQAQFSQPDYALTVYCDPTTQVRYVVPPLEVFDPKKYKQVEKEIKEVLNLPSFMWNNDGGGTFGAAMQEVQLLRQEIASLRLLLAEQLFRPLYNRLRIGVSNAPAVKDIPLPVFDQDSLRDDTIWLGATKEMYGVGALSLKTLMESYGFDFDYEMAQKKLEHEKFGNTADGAEMLNNTTARPLYEPSQGNMKPKTDETAGGNPGNGGTPTNPTRNPRKTKE